MHPHEEIAAHLDGGGNISAARLAEWLAAEDEETLAGALALVRTLGARIEGRLDAALLAAAARRYYSLALAANRAGRFLEDRRTAAVGLAEWYLRLCDEEPLPRAVLDALKDTLAALYRRGDDALRATIITACLDRLFESRRIAMEFADWADDPALAPARRAALDWGEGFWTRHRSDAGGG
jgi:hypothetical protein